jgi:hypothetical protein
MHANSRNAAAQVDAEDFSWVVARLGGCCESFTKADCHRMLLPRPIPLQPGSFYMLSANIQVLAKCCGSRTSALAFCS